MRSQRVRLVRRRRRGSRARRASGPPTYPPPPPRRPQDFAAAEAVQFGATILAVSWCFLLLRSRLGELRLSALVMALAGLPFYYFLKGLLAIYSPSRGNKMGAGAARRAARAGRGGKLGGEARGAAARARVRA